MSTIPQRKQIAMGKSSQATNLCKGGKVNMAKGGKVLSGKKC